MWAVLTNDKQVCVVNIRVLPLYGCPATMSTRVDPSPAGTNLTLKEAYFYWRNYAENIVE